VNIITLQSPGNILFSIGAINIHWYGIIIAIAFLAGLAVAVYIAKQENIDPDEIINLSALLLVAGVVFARLYYVIFNWNYFSKHIAEIFMLWQGGLSIHGVIIGCSAIFLVYAKVKKLPLFKYMSIFACALPLGQAIGRWGNFFNSEAFGMPTSLPLRVYIPPEFRPLEYINHEFFHPTFLYESIWNLIVFLILFFFVRIRFKDYGGMVAFSYLILYSTGRYFIEAIRLDNIYSICGLHIAQFISLLLIAIGMFSIFYSIYRKKHPYKQ